MSSDLLRQAGRRQGPGSDNGAMLLRVANLAIRSVAFVYVGIETFILAPRPGAAVVAMQIAAFSVTGILMVLSPIAERSQDRGHPFGRLLPYILAGIVVACAAVSPLRNGGNLVALAFIAVLTAGSGISLATGWIVTGLGIAVIEAVGIPRGVGGTVTFGYPAALLVGLLLGFNRRDHRVQAEQAAALAARSEQLRQEQARIATLDERARIAREIHDLLAHSLGALGLNIQLAQAVLADQHDEARAVELLEQARRMAADGLAETRRAVHALRGQTPPLAEGLAELSADHERRHGAKVTFEVTGEPHPMPPDAGLALSRAAQEALVNAAKHAPHQPVQIRLDYGEDATSLVVMSQLSDNSNIGGGHGDNSNSGGEFATVDGGYGLSGMRERLLLLDGTLSAGRSGGDWVVEAKVPR